MRARVLCLLALLSVAACGSDAPERAHRTPGFAPDEHVSPSSGPIVFLRGAPGDGPTVEVVAHGIEGTVHGAAFRLAWDPARLAFVDARAGRVWPSGSLRLAKEGAPGELVVAWTEKGAEGGVRSSGETVLGTLVFRRTGPGDVGMEFRVERSTLRDATGKTLQAEWRGGRVAN